MSRINSRQLLALLVLSSAFNIICISGIYGSGQILGALTACMLGGVLSVPLLILPERSTETVYRRKWLSVIYILFFLLWGAGTLKTLNSSAPTQLLNVSGHLKGLILIFVTCLFTSTNGIKATARSAPIILAVMTCSALILIIGAWKRIDLDTFIPESAGFQEGFTSCMTGELATAVVLGHKGNLKKSILQYLAVKFFLYSLVIFLCLTVGGRLTQNEAYPFFTLTALSQPLRGQRADAFYILVFVMLTILHITLQTSLTAHLLESAFPKLRGTAPISLMVMLLLAWLLPERILQISEHCMIPLLVCAVPMGIRLAQTRRKAVTS